jgi:hypothetical protein
MATINLKKVICISLKSHTEDQLDAIAATYDISWESLCDAKKGGTKKLWIHIGGGLVIAGLDTENIEDVYFSKDYLPILTAKIRKAVLAIRPVKVPKMPTWAKVDNKSKVENEIEGIDISELFDLNLDVDTILDKISAKGMASLTKKELEFLKENSK